MTEAAGAVLVAAQTAAAPALAPPADPGPATNERLHLSADGVLVALTDGTWAAVKNVASGRVTTPGDGRPLATRPEWLLMLQLLQKDEAHPAVAGQSHLNWGGQAACLATEGAV